MCRVTSDLTELEPAPAACLIKLHGKLLALKYQDDEAWHLPAGKKQQNTSAQCTAHQAVWKNTGLNIEVDNLLFTTSNHTHVFACHVSDDFAKQLATFDVPGWSKRNLRKIDLIDPFDIPKAQWPTSADLIQIRQGFTQIED